MLRALRIRHLAVIEAMDIEFDQGFTAITGETGAGKSVLVEAVGVLLGARASADLVRTGEPLATIEAIFDRGAAGEILVRREITSLGRSRAFVDGALATAGTLRALGLVDVHAQHEHQSLLDPSTHLPFLDAYAELDLEAAGVSEAWQRVRALAEARDRSTMDVREKAARLDLLTFQLGEISALQLRPGEDEELQTAKRVAANASRIRRLSEESYLALYDGDGAVLARLAGVWKHVGELASVDSRFREHLEARDGIKSQLEDLADVLRGLADLSDASPSQLQDIEDRLALVERIKRKYGPTIGDVLERGRALTLERDLLDGSSLEGERLEAEAAEARQGFLARARTLATKRRSAAARFTADLSALLAELAMSRTKFEVRFTSQESQPGSWGAEGIDLVEFFVSPNPGEELRPLARVVSGGELSRMMLALKTLGARTRPSAETGTKTLIFDEVDAGIGGRVAHVVGRSLRALARDIQVLCVTHLPQIAAQAAVHYRLEKAVVRGRTVAAIGRLDESGRVEEIARMLAGSATGDSARLAARALLAEGRPEAKGKHKAKGESETPRPGR
jgi:DNA repair protein RecN (Recombination protein N)